MSRIVLTLCPLLLAGAVFGKNPEKTVSSPIPEPYPALTGKP